MRGNRKVIARRLGPGGADKERRQKARGSLAGQRGGGGGGNERATEAGDKGGLLRKPIRASRQSLLPRTTWWHTASLSLSLPNPLSLSPRFYRVFAERSASGDTLKSHEICRATPSRSLHTSGREYTRLHPRRQKAYPSWKPCTTCIYVYISPSLSLDARERRALERSAFARYLGDPSVALPQRRPGEILPTPSLPSAGGADAIGKCLYNSIGMV